MILILFALIYISSLKLFISLLSYIFIYQHFPVQGNMKQHQMTHKFRDSSSDPTAESAGQHSNGPPSKSPESSPLHSPPLSPPLAGGGVKRSQEVAAMVERPPEKRAILCG